MKPISDQALFDSLIELEVIDKTKLQESLKEAQSKNIPFQQTLLKKNLISDENLGKIVADLYNLPFVNLAESSIETQVLHIVPEEIAKKLKLVAFSQPNGVLHVAACLPPHSLFFELLKKKVKGKIKLFYATERDITNAFDLYADDAASAFSDMIEKYVQEAKNASHSDPPIITLVDMIITYSYQNEASDVHIEPAEEYLLVRFRIDGVMHDIVKLPPELHAMITSRIKVLAGLRTDEHQSSQDGKIVYKLENENLDIRVSIVPVTRGENIVMRLLSERSRDFDLESLGLLKEDLKKIEQSYEAPHGMILVTGPTGSGKTTSLYAIVKILNRRDVNIMTIEDPVEYDLENVNQIQVNTETDLTFAQGLRSIVRQDPDIILVGEIRDDETAGIAVNSAMTGHLVLSTLHTNDAATTLPRLTDMKIEPFLIASTVHTIIAQRLIRTICVKCRTSYEMSSKDTISSLAHVPKTLVKKIFGSKSKIRAYKGKGCKVCHNTGYKGRIGIFEILVMDDVIRTAITDQKDATVIKNLAVKQGMKTMFEDGIAKVLEGITTIEEVLRVTSDQ